MFSLLPLSLLALVFYSPMLIVHAQLEPEPTSSNDAFRAIALHKPKQTEEPICCLKPLTPPEPVDDNILVLSFEEWKMKQQLASHSDAAIAQQQQASNHEQDSPVSSPPGADEPAQLGNEALISSTTGDSSDMYPNANSGQVNLSGSGPRFRVPLTDRFNYASLECSARVHTAHRSAKSPSNILSSKKDRYMLSPCDKSKERQFVIVELCDDIRIDTVQLANFEFFSGVFKDFSVSVAKTLYTTDPDGWTPVATYRAKNVRGVQSFHPPNSLRDFYRFMRIDFLSHYGNEFYCPVSLLRVYGLTHLEEWKWDTWEAESRSRAMQKKRQPVIDPSANDNIVVPPILHADTVSEFTTTINKDENPDNTVLIAPPLADNHPPPPAMNSNEHPPPPTALSDDLQQPTLHVHALTTPTNAIPYSASLPEDHSSVIPVPSTDSASTTTTPSDMNTSNTQHRVQQQPTASTESPFSNAHVQATPGTATTLSPAPNSSSSTSSASFSTAAVISFAPPPPVIIPPPPLPTTKGGESIYRTILNKLAEVELNQTLYMQYIEQQNVKVREVIRRLGEDMGRLEGIGRAQSSTYQRTIYEWESERYQLEMEHHDLMARIDSLSEEIILEKRLGIAQLCLLLAVLVFLGLTRGSRVESLGQHELVAPRSLREWGRRHLRLSGDWAGRLKGKVGRDGEGRREGSSSTEREKEKERPRLKAHKSTKSYPPPLSLEDNSESSSSRTHPSTTSRPYPYVLGHRNALQNKENVLGLEGIPSLSNLNTAPASRDVFATRTRTRTTSNPRSRAPLSVRTTPTGGRRHPHNHNHTRPITPISSTYSGSVLRPSMLQRSSSHHGVPSLSHGGGSLTGGAVGGGASGSGMMPKSAKKWARSAHLHEVKTPVPVSVTASLGNEKKGGEGSFFMIGKDGEHLENGNITSVDNLGGQVRTCSLLPEDDDDPWIDTDSVDGTEEDTQVDETTTTKLVPFPS